MFLLKKNINRVELEISSQISFSQFAFALDS